VDMFEPSIDWGHALVDSLSWIAVTWLISAVCVIVVLAFMLCGRALEVVPAKIAEVGRIEALMVERGLAVYDVALDEVAQGWAQEREERRGAALERNRAHLAAVRDERLGLRMEVVLGAADAGRLRTLATACGTTVQGLVHEVLRRVSAAEGGGRVVCVPGFVPPVQAGAVPAPTADAPAAPVPRRTLRRPTVRRPLPFRETDTES